MIWLWLWPLIILLFILLIYLFFSTYRQSSTLHTIQKRVKEKIVLQPVSKIGPPPLEHFQQLVYPISMREWIAIDPRWNTIINEFQSMMSKPFTERTWTEEEHIFYKEATGFPDNITDVNTLRVQPLHVSNGWIQSKGKWEKNLSLLLRQGIYQSFNQHLREVLHADITIHHYYYYPSGGCYPWHHVYKDGWQLDLVYSSGSSAFCYVDHHKKNVLVDRKEEFMVYLYPVGSSIPYSIYSDSDRWSISVYLEEKDARRLLKNTISRLGYDVIQERLYGFLVSIDAHASVKGELSVLHHLMYVYTAIKEETANDLLSLIGGLYCVYETGLLSYEDVQIEQLFGTEIDRLVRLYSPTCFTDGTLDKDDEYALKWIPYAVNNLS